LLARKHIGELLDILPATIRNWIEAQERQGGQQSQPAKAVDSAEVRELKREVAELRRAACPTADHNGIRTRRVAEVIDLVGLHDVAGTWVGGTCCGTTAPSCSTERRHRRSIDARNRIRRNVHLRGNADSDAQRGRSTALTRDLLFAAVLRDPANRR
jgi:hypothetical protein